MEKKAFGRLIEACLSADLRRVEAIVSSGCPVNRLSHGAQPLAAACFAGYCRNMPCIIDCCLRRGVLCNANKKPDSTGCQCYAKDDDIALRVVTLLVGSGADVNHRQLPHSTSALDLAADGGFLACMDLLLTNGAEVTSKTLTFAASRISQSEHLLVRVVFVACFLKALAAFARPTSEDASTVCLKLTRLGLVDVLKELLHSWSHLIDVSYVLNVVIAEDHTDEQKERRKPAVTWLAESNRTSLMNACRTTVRRCLSSASDPSRLSGVIGGLELPLEVKDFLRYDTQYS